MALNAYTLYNDAKDLKQGNMKNRSTTGLALESTLVLLQMVLWRRWVLLLPEQQWPVQQS